MAMHEVSSHRQGTRLRLAEPFAVKRLREQKEGDAFTFFSAEETGCLQSVERRKLDNFNCTFITVLDIICGRSKRKREGADGSLL